MKILQRLSVLTLFLLAAVSAFSQEEFSPDIWLDRFDFKFSASGEVSGIATGTLSVSGTDMVELSIYDEDEGEYEQLIFTPNAGKDVLFAMINDEPEEYPETEFIFLSLIKKPVVLTQGDLAGDWRLVELEVGQDAGLSAVQPATFSDILSIDSTGTVSVAGETATASVNSNLQVELDFDDDSLVFDMAAGKTMMVNMVEDEDQTIYLRYLMKSSTVSSLSEVEGDWRADSIEIESVPDRDYSAFYMEGTAVTLLTNGTFSSPDGESGSLSIHAGEDLALQDSDEPVADIFRLNGAHDFAVMAAEFDEGEYHDLIVLSKEPASLSVTDLAGDWAVYDFSIEHIQNASLRTNTYYWEDEVTVSQYFSLYYTNGYEIRHGFFENNHSNGTAAVRATYVDGQLDGVWEVYTEDGDLTEEIEYELGQELNSLRISYYYPSRATNTLERYEYDTNGVWIAEFQSSFFEDGRLSYAQRSLPGTPGMPSWSTNYSYRIDDTLEWYSAYYSDDHSSSSSNASYHADGITPSSYSYSTNGGLHGAQEQFASNGIRIGLQVYQFGKLEGPSESWTEASIRTYAANYEKNRLQGDEYSYRELDGKILTHNRFEFGIPTYSKNYGYHPNGVLASTFETTIRSTGNIVVERGWNSSGQPAYFWRNVGGKLDGEQLSYSTGGMLIERSNYDRGVLVGSWELYFDNGQLQQSGTYEKGRKTGIWTEYDVSGTQVAEIGYANGRRNGDATYWMPDGKLSQEVTSSNGFDTDTTVYSYHDNGILASVVETLHQEDGTRKNFQHYWENGNQQSIHSLWNNEIDGLQKSWAENGQLESSLEYKNGLFHGLVEYWNDDGTPQLSVHYEYGVLNGESLHYYFDNGILTGHEQYVDGKKSGLQIYYHYSSGDLSERVEMLENQKHGTRETFREDGTLSSRCEYVYDVLNGRCLDYHDDGTTVRVDANYTDGLLNGVRKVYSATGFQTQGETYSAGIPDGAAFNAYEGGGRYEYVYQDGVYHGNYDSYNAAGVRIQRTPYNLGIIEGTIRYWHSNGQPSQTIVYLDGVQEGAFRQYNTTGSLTLSGTYSKGLRHGVFSSYSNGNLYATTTWVYGVRHGAYRSYHTSGQLSQRGQYAGGQQSGTWTSYNSDGSVSNSHNYGSGGSAPETPELNDPTVNAQIKVALRGENGAPIEGTVWFVFGNQQTNYLNVGASGSAISGIYGISNSVSVTVTGTSLGYFTNSTSASVSMTSPSDEVTLQLSRFAGPVISNVTPLDGDHFMHGIPYDAAFELDLDWGESTAGHIRAVINGVDYQHHYGWEGQISVDMGSGLFEPNASQTANSLEFIAVSQEGIESAPFELNPVVYPMPTWAPRALGVFTRSYDEPGYTLSLEFPAEPFEASFEPEDLHENLQPLWEPVPYVGGYGFGLLPTQVGLEAFISTEGLGDAAADGKSGFKAAGAQVEMVLEGAGSTGFNYGSAGGPVLEALDLTAEVKSNISREQGLLDLFPALKNIKNTYPKVGPWVESVASIAKVSITLGLDGISMMKLGEDPASGELVFTEANGSVTGSVGLDLSVPGKTFSTTLSGASSIVYDWTSPPGDNTFDYTLDGSGSFGLNLKLFSFDVFTEDLVVWGAAPASAEGFLTMSVSAMDVGFLQQPDFNTLGVGALNLAPATNSALIQNIFPRANPKLIGGDNVHAVIYLSMDPADPVEQASEVNLLYYDGTNYLAPVAVENNALGEFAPDAVFLEDGRMLAVWERVKNPALTATDLDAFIAAMEVVWSVYTPATSSWSVPVALTDNAYLDHHPALLAEGTNTLVIWESNTGSELLSSTISPSELNVAVWNGTSFDTPETMPGSFSGARDFTAALSDGELKVAYLQDADADYSTVGDTDIYLLEEDESGNWNPPYQLTISSVDESDPLLIAKTNSFELFWIREGALVRASGFSSGSFEEVVPAAELGTYTDYTVIPDGNDLLLSWSGTEVHAKKHNDYFWHPAQCLTGSGVDKNTLSGALLSSGSLALVYLEADAQSALKLVEAMPGQDFAARSFALDPVSSVATGEYVQVTATIESRGLASTNEVTVVLYEGDPDSGGIALETNTLFFHSSVSEQWETYYQIPGVTNQVELFCVVDPDDDVVESDELNNVASLALFRPNLKIIDLEIAASSGSVHQVTAAIQNNGTLAAAPSQIGFDAGGGPIQLLPVDALGIGEATSIMVQFSDASFFSNHVANLVVSVDPNNWVAESNEGDNSLSVSMPEPIPAFADIDSDDMDDYWEMIVFGDLDENGLLDSDGDGMNDRAEYFAGTHPFDKTSALRVGLGVRSDDSLLEWNTEPGVTYRLEYTTDLASDVWIPIGGDRATPGYESSVDSQIDPLTAGNRFYRVRVVTP